MFVILVGKGGIIGFSLELEGTLKIVFLPLAPAKE